MGYILDQLNHVRNSIGHPEDIENQDKEKLKEKLKKYIKTEILPNIQLIDNGYDYEFRFPKYKLWELLHYPNIIQVLEELEKDKQLEIYNLLLAIENDPLCSTLYKDLLKKYRSPK